MILGARNVALHTGLHLWRQEKNRKKEADHSRFLGGRVEEFTNKETYTGGRSRVAAR